MRRHDLNGGYRQMFGLPANYPIVAPRYSERRSKLAKDAGLGLKKSRWKKRREALSALVLDRNEPKVF